MTTMTYRSGLILLNSGRALSGLLCQADLPSLAKYGLMLGSKYPAKIRKDRFYAHTHQITTK